MSSALQRFQQWASTGEVLQRQAPQSDDATAVQVQTVEAGEGDAWRWPEAAAPAQGIAAEAEAGQPPQCAQGFNLQANGEITSLEGLS